MGYKDNNKSNQSFLAMQYTRCNRQLSVEALLQTMIHERNCQFEKQAASILISLGRLKYILDSMFYRGFSGFPANEFAKTMFQKLNARTSSFLQHRQPRNPLTIIGNPEENLILLGITII